MTSGLKEVDASVTNRLYEIDDDNLMVVSYFIQQFYPGLTHQGIVDFDRYSSSKLYRNTVHIS